MSEDLNLHQVMKSVYEIFKTFDKDNSDTLEVGELMNLLKACKINVTPLECDVIMQEMDSNQDGVMDFEEFMSFLGMIFKLRFSKTMKVKEEFEMKREKLLKKSTPRKSSLGKASKPDPPPRRGSAVQTASITRF